MFLERPHFKWKKTKLNCGIKANKELVLCLLTLLTFYLYHIPLTPFLTFN